MKRDDTKKNFTSLSGNDLQTVRLHYPSFPCIIAIVPVSRLLNLMRYSSVLNANIRFFCSENRNFTLKEVPSTSTCVSLVFMTNGFLGFLVTSKNPSPFIRILRFFSLKSSGISNLLSELSVTFLPYLKGIFYAGVDFAFFRIWKKIIQ